ncbi:hypothetical protein Hanom_Chr05g00473371 [Helianthus anomalus]
MFFRQNGDRARGLFFLYYFFNKLSFWSMWFEHFYYFSPNLKLFKSGSLWFHSFCHFSPKVKFGQIPQLKSLYFVFILRGILIIFVLL